MRELLSGRALPAEAVGARRSRFQVLSRSGGRPPCRIGIRMKKLLSTLYVTTQGTYISRDGETVLVKKADEILLRVPIHTLHGIVCFGRVSMSGPLMGSCGERQVQVSFLSEPGEFQARVQGPV